MPDPHQPFPRSTQLRALARQGGLCVSCGTRIVTPGQAGAVDHRFGESAEGHHMVPHSMGGSLTLDNCVVVCRACHLNAHQGGRFRDLDIYDDLTSLSLPDRIRKLKRLYPFCR